MLNLNFLKIKQKLFDIATECVIMCEPVDLLMLAKSCSNFGVMSQLKNPDKLKSIVRRYATTTSKSTPLFLHYHSKCITDVDFEEEPTERSLKGPHFKSRHPLVALIRCFSLFPNKSLIVRPLIDEICACWNSDNNFESVTLIFQILRELDSRLSNSPLVRGIFEDRKEWLEYKLKNKPEFSWCMPSAKAEKHPKVEEFLKSSRAEMDYELPSSADLAGFVFLYNTEELSVRNEFSIVVSKKSANVVRIKKTRAWFNRQAERLQRDSIELMAINQFLP